MPGYEDGAVTVALPGLVTETDQNEPIPAV